MRIHRVGRHVTAKGLTYAQELRHVVSLATGDPGPPVALDIEPRDWARIAPLDELPQTA